MNGLPSLTGMTNKAAGLPRNVGTFVVLPENELALTAGENLLGSGLENSPQLQYVYGPSGVGKTHLVQHCLQMSRAHEPRLPLIMWPAAEFVERFSQAAEEGRIREFQNRFNEVDLLVLEDVQVFERRRESQQQLESQLDRLIQRGGRVLLTSRKSPGELSGFSARLINRFIGGVSTAMRMPGATSRIKFLTHFAETEQIPISSAAISHLAQDLAVSPRELRAALVQLEAAAVHGKQPLDESLIAKYLQREALQPELQLSDIVRAVAREFELSMVDIRSKSRHQEFVLARQTAMYLARKLTQNRLETIGQFFSDRDHATVVYACHRIDELISQRPHLRRRLAGILETLEVHDDITC